MFLPDPFRLFLGAGLLALASACGGGGGAPLPAPAITAFTAAPAMVTAGAAASLTATFTGGSATISPGVGGATSGLPVGTGPLYADTTFTLTVANASGASVTATATVDVVPAPAITAFTNSGPVTAGSTASLTPVFSGGNGVVTPGNLPVSSGVALTTPVLLATTTYTLTVTNTAGGTVTAATTVTVAPAPAIASFTSAGTVTPGAPAVLTAFFANGTGLVMPGNLPITSGKPMVTGPLTTGTTFTLTVTGSGGARATAATTVGVGTALDALDLAITGPAGGTGALVNVFGPLGLIASAAASENFTGLSSGTYAVVPAGVWGTGAQAGQVFQASGGQGWNLGTGTTAQAGVTYASVPSLTFQLPDATHPGATVALALVTLPAGSFLMGAYPGEQDGQDVEMPQHTVSLTRSILMAEFPTTQAQWQALMGSNPSTFSVANQGAATDDFSRPVEEVSWNDVTAAQTGFLARLNAATAATRPAGTAFRLPTEAEWEYACRAGTTTRFYWGDDPFYSVIDRYAWWSSDASGSTHAVGSLGPDSANPFGLFDMNGNVFEWCQDWYGPYAAGTASDPQGAASGTYRVVRGGAWYYGDLYCRSANRSYSGPNDRFPSIGFRVVLAAP